MRRPLAAFSLIELIAVMAIITIVAGFTVPALKGLTDGNAVDAGAAAFADLLVLGRSQAISRHTVVRLVVTTEWPGLETQANFRRASLWAWHQGGNSTAGTKLLSTNGYFLQTSAWQDLPMGLVFEPGVPGYVLNAAYAQQDSSTVRGSCILANDQNNFGTYASFAAPTTSGPISTRYLEFLPTGAVNLPGSPDRQAIFVASLGYINPSLQVVHTTQSNGQPANWAQINVDTLTGRVHVYRP
jgi:prepilin-type N-terminal cleavage/methylation domain-containing protein